MINELHKLRNSVAHLTVTPDKTMAQKSINLARIIFEALEERWEEEKRCVVCGSPDVVGVEKSVTIDISKIKNKKDLEKAMEKKEGRIIGFYCKKHEPYWTR